jgi:hypothetical protein
VNRRADIEFCTIVQIHSGFLVAICAASLIPLLGIPLRAQAIAEPKILQSGIVATVPPPDGSTIAGDGLAGHAGLNGKPCLSIEGYVKTQIINKDIYEHWIRARNSCGQYIKIRVCYRKSESCISMNVPPWESENAVLGIAPKAPDFQYLVNEKF